MDQPKKKYITCDGNQAAAHIAYLFSEMAAIFPITPSSTMAEHVDEWAANKRKNMFGEIVHVEEMQSEAGAAGAMHGALQSGVLSTTFTASQGLLLMLPDMYKVAGELLPGVYHVTARSVAAQALSIFGDHQDVMAVRQAGCALFASGSVQEVMDLAGVAHLAAIKSRVPFVHFFDGFRTSHEIQKIALIDTDKLVSLVDKEKLDAFRQRALNPEHPVVRGTAQNPDIYFQAREASNVFYNAVPEIVEEYLNEINAITGRNYGLFDYYGDPEAEHIIIAIGSVCKTIKEAVDYLNEKGEKTGIVAVHLYRPFSIKHFMKAIPSSVKRIAVLDRTKEPGAPGEPLYLDVRNAFYGLPNNPLIVGGRYGLSSKDTTPAQMVAVFENLFLKEPKNNFTIGITDDVTYTSLPYKNDIPIKREGIFEAKFYGLGSDGTVGANKNTIKIIGDNTDKYCQAYFAYDSKKSGGFTASHLRFGERRISSTYLINTPDFVACHVPLYLHLYDVTKGLKKNGTFLLNSKWDAEEVKDHLPAKVKKYFADNNINFYIINATAIAEDIGLGKRTNTILQSAFFKISQVIPYELAVEQMKAHIKKSYSRKGDDVVQMNYTAVDRGGEVMKINVPDEWADIVADEGSFSQNGIPEFIKNVVRPMNEMEGDMLPVSAFAGREDGTWDVGTAAFEKRGVATHVPVWIPENCTQCNQCAYVCPHAAIRPFVLNENEMTTAPAFPVLKAIGKQFDNMSYRLQVSVYDCMGCDNCVDICPGIKGRRALEMVPIEEQLFEGPNWEYCVKEVKTKQSLVDVKNNVKNSQFATPLFEFSGACSGCGETPYIKLITQLYGDHQMIANATGCTSIYSASAPSVPYTKNEYGCGPAWGNPLFENNAEFGLGMRLAVDSMRDRIEHVMQDAIELGSCGDELKGLFKEWIEHKKSTEITKTLSDKIIPALQEHDECKYCRDILELKQYLVEKSVWLVGGDGWAYDIGYGGLDHVLASGKNVNVLVVDTEVYSNTGGQASKSTPVGAIAKFAASGKKIRKKDLGLMATTYGYIYAAQVSMGANQMQTLKAIREAEAYDGPSVVIAYSPCISHGLHRGMGKAQDEQKLAVECGYWHLWRYNPELEAAGKTPFQLDSKDPDWSKFQDFVRLEVRFSSLEKQFPKEAKELLEASESNARWRYENYKRLSGM